ncbi:MAG: hypothetical protein M0Q46_06240, partial [Endomicrobiales bacterium]|nr:hypothetical protein [Endomicrobiales bacterium]
ISYAGTPFSVEASTYAVAGEATAAQISGQIDISNLVISNSGATQQTVILYELAASSTTIDDVITIIIPASAGFYRPFGDLDYNDRVRITDFAVRKSTTASTIYVGGIYQ